MAIIADDLTGASDSGVQLARQGFRSAVLFDVEQRAEKKPMPPDAPHSQEASEPVSIQHLDTVILDTDSRSLPQKEAYKRVQQAAEWVRSQGIDIIYKKIDSTMRGNIGAELDAVYDTFRPDVVIIAPGYPQNGRTVVDGYHYLHGQLLHHTEMAYDPKTPVTESFVPRLVSLQSRHSLGIINRDMLEEGIQPISAQLQRYSSQGVQYIVFDSQTEADLERIAKSVKESGCSAVWVGSAGLAHTLPSTLFSTKASDPPVLKSARSVIQSTAYDSATHHSTMQKPARHPSPQNLPTAYVGDEDVEPVLIVVGSVSDVSRSQLDTVLKESNVYGICLDSAAVVGDERERQHELDRVTQELYKGIQQHKEQRDHHAHIALYAAGTAQDKTRAIQAGAKQGMDQTMVSNEIVQALGEVTTHIVQEGMVQRLIVTGGDTAKQVCTHMGATGIQLWDEVETGIPIGQFIGLTQSIQVMTKAGAFGDGETLLRLLQYFEGGKDRDHTEKSTNNEPTDNE